MNEKNNSNVTEPQNSKFTIFVLSLLFFTLFAYIMFLPSIRNYFQQRKFASVTNIEKQPEKTNSPTPSSTPIKEELFETVCTSISTTIDHYTFVQTQKFYSNSKNQILKSSIIMDYSFTMQDEVYESLKNQCSDETYFAYPGYTLSCNIDHNTIIMMQEFNLSTFQTVVDAEKNLRIEANTSYRQELSSVKSNLINQGYTCN